MKRQLTAKGSVALGRLKVSFTKIKTLRLLKTKTGTNISTAPSQIYPHLWHKYTQRSRTNITFSFGRNPAAGHQGSGPRLRTKAPHQGYAPRFCTSRAPRMSRYFMSTMQVSLEGDFFQIFGEVNILAGRVNFNEDLATRMTGSLA